jgi:hypothetical protein
LDIDILLEGCVKVNGIGERQRRGFIDWEFDFIRVESNLRASIDSRVGAEDLGSRSQRRTPHCIVFRTRRTDVKKFQSPHNLSQEPHTLLFPTNFHFHPTPQSAPPLKHLPQHASSETTLDYGEVVDQVPVLNVKDEVFENVPDFGSGAE